MREAIKAFLATWESLPITQRDKLRREQPKLYNAILVLKYSARKSR